MNIALVTNTFLPQIGGIEWKVHYLASEYARRGNQVTVFSARVPRAKPVDVQGAGNYRLLWVGPPPLPGLGRSGLQTLLFSRALDRRHQETPFDILHCHAIDLPTRAGVKFKKRRGVPVVATTAGHDILTMPSLGHGIRLSPHYDSMVCHNMQHADIVGSISRAVRRELESIGTKARIVDIPNGVDWETFQTGPSDFLRRRLGIGGADLIVVSVGRHHPLKAYEVGIQAFARLAREIPAAHYVLVGRAVSTLKSFAEGLRLRGRVHFIDGVPIDDVPKVLRSADVFFSPSILEGFSQVVVQAMACGCPCVLSDCPGNEDFAGHPGAVLGCRGDPVSLAAALRRPLESGDLRRGMGRAAHASSRRYDWKVISREYLALFEETLRQKAGTLSPVHAG